ncbi:hypothetical protein [Flavobacterium soyae]|uniref:hypothetical protein n=1 Tax=Flavobacterium soyae TaxID=2903098 RepID=UPI001E4F509A|nr:hypothetical protein [Flavobacterium soyae]MCD9576705.1 hypothetical protein [Flavobacterium soyae]
MAGFYFPSSGILQKVFDLVQGFYFEIDKNDTVVLLLKFEASVITSLIKGANIELILRNPKISPRTITLYIHDHPVSPLWTTWYEFSNEDTKFKGFDRIAIKLLEATEVRVVYFNEMNISVFTKILKKKNHFEEFKIWYDNIESSKTKFETIYDGYFLPENPSKGFSIQIENEDYSKEEKIIISSYTETLNWGEKSINDKEYYNLNDFLEDGKHGYNQELSIRANLTRYFLPNQELFHSLLKTDNTELTDFLIEYRNAVIIIESKYILSNKQRQLNSALVKAVDQLNNAEQIIFTQTSSIQNIELNDRLQNCEIVIKICLHNDNVILTEKSTRNVVEKYNKNDLPIFMSVATFSQLLAKIYLLNNEKVKFNIFKNLITLYENHLESNDKILAISSTYF